MGDLTRNLDSSELVCKCGCGFSVKNEYHIDKLQAARTLAGIGFKIKSWCRCKKHNKIEGGTDKSDHLTGEGTDIECLNSVVRHKILKAAYAVGFRRIGEGKTFIHLGTAKRNPQDVHWQY
jgi:hypothetical protein